MHSRLSLLCALALPLSLSGCKSFDFINMKAKDTYSVTIHSQGSVNDSPRSIFPMPLPGRAERVIFKIVPEFSHSNVSAVTPFPANNGNGNGIMMKLDFRGAEALEIATRTMHGQVLLAMVNGQPVDFLTIDRPVADGIYTIWEGVSDEVVAQMQKKLPPIKRLKSMSGAQDMLPTTKGEKRRSVKAANDLEKLKGDITNPTDPSAVQAPRSLANPDGGNGLPRPGSGATVPINGSMHDRSLPLINR
jgi:hypothetical protein